MHQGDGVHPIGIGYKQNCKASHFPSNQDNLPNTLMFIHSDMSDIERHIYFTNSQVLNNIIRLGRNWIEFDKNARIN